MNLSTTFKMNTQSVTLYAVYSRLLSALHSLPLSAQNLQRFVSNPRPVLIISCRQCDGLTWCAPDSAAAPSARHRGTCLKCYKITLWDGAVARAEPSLALVFYVVENSEAGDEEEVNDNDQLVEQGERGAAEVDIVL